MLKPLLLLSSIVLVGIMPAIAPGHMTQESAPAPAQAPSNTTKNPVKATPESQAKAKKLYKEDCEMCHGATGDGKTDLAKDMQLTMSDLSNPTTLSGKSDGDLFDMIRKGKDKMPAEDKARANDESLWNLIIYLRSLPKEQPATATTDKPSN